MLWGTRVELSLQGRCALLRLFNPEPPYGCFDGASESEFLQALDVLEREENVRVLIVTGREEGMFVRHYDVGTLERIGRKMVQRDLHFSPDHPPPPGGFHRILERLEQAPYLQIAAINGWCMGGGLELALGCHLRYAQSGDYRIGLPEVQLNLLPGAGGTQRLGHVVGQARALEMLLLGTCVSPEDAARIDLVHAVVPNALQHAQQVAAQLAQRPPALLRHIVQLHGEAQQLSAGEGMARERGAFSSILRDPLTLERMAQYNSGSFQIPE